MHRFCVFALSLLNFLALLAPAHSAPVQETAQKPLIIATKEAAPFSFCIDGGAWQGVSIDLWRSVAGDLGLEFEFKEAPLADLITGLTDGRFDASVAALTVTPGREKLVDFTHAIHPSGLGIAVQANNRSIGFFAVLKNLFTVEFFKAVGTLFVVLFVVLFLGGTVVWLLERRRNAEQFGGPPAKALFESPSTRPSWNA